MKEGSGTVANDTTSYTNNLTLNTASWTANAKIGTGWNGVGTNWLSRADDADFDFAAADNFSISFWYKSDSATNPGNAEHALAKINSSNPGYQIRFTTGGVAKLQIDDDSNFGPDDEAGTLDTYDATWHHLSAVKTGTSKIELYIDGVLNDSDNTLAATGTLANTLNLVAGDRTATDGSDEFTGDLDQITISRTNRTLGWLNTEYNNQNNPASFITVNTEESF